MSGDRLCDEWDPRSAAGEDDSDQIGRYEVGRRDRTIKDVQAFGDRRSKARLELVAGDTDLCCESRYGNLDRRLALDRESQLGCRAGRAELQNACTNGWVAAVQLLQCAAEGRHHVIEDDLIDLVTTEPFEALRCANYGWSCSRQRDDRGITGTSEVVDRHRVTLVYASGCLVATRCGDRLTDQLDVGEAVRRCHVSQQTDLVFAPAGRVRKRQRCGCSVDAR